MLDFLFHYSYWIVGGLAFTYLCWQCYRLDKKINAVEQVYIDRVIGDLRDKFKRRKGEQK